MEVNEHAGLDDKHRKLAEQNYSLAVDLCSRNIPFPKFRLLQKIKFVDSDLKGEIKGMAIYFDGMLEPDPGYHWVYQLSVENGEWLECVEETEIIEVSDD